MGRVPSTAVSRKGRERREQIIQAAIEAFAAHGSRRVSLASIARTVGITEQGVMHYFPTKVHLLLGILERDEQDATEAWRELVAEGLTVLEALMEIMRRRTERATLQSVLMAESVDLEHPAHEWFAARNERVRGALAATFASAQRDGVMRNDVDPDAVAGQVQALVVGLSLSHALAGGRSDAPAVFEAFLRRLTPDGRLRSLAHVRAERARAA